MFGDDACEQGYEARLQKHGLTSMAQSTDFRRNISLQAIKPQLGRRLADVERDLVMATLLRCGGNRTWAADILGLSLQDLRDRLLSYQAQDGERTAGRVETRDDQYRALLEAYDPGLTLPC